ncbi:TIGR04372 family glycosyltransferase [Candidatus Pelagibacter sp.]|uniref:TIGR04372 family glycosyltransferase n=1 Tax=Candidatus Pelagibacter sp. TaxID=2024849 RepID=UPI003F846D91
MIWHLSSIKKIIRYLLIISIFPLSVLIFILIIILSPLILIRIGKFRNDKIGHLALDYEIYLEEKKRNIKFPNKLFLDIWFKHKITCNKFLLKLRYKNFYIFPNIFFEGIYFLFNFFNLKNFNPERSNPDADINYVLGDSESKIKIDVNNFENIYRQMLYKYGLKPNQKIVLIHLRDAAYRGLSDFTDFRNIYHKENYIETINFLTKNNYFVIRVGRAAEYKFNIEKNFFDYAFSEIKSDQMDLFLAKYCYFCISTCSGFAGLVRAFRNPVLLTNYIPHGHYDSYVKKNLTIFKHMISEDQKKMSLNEILNTGLINSWDGREFKKQKILFQENSSEEILKSSKDMIEYIENNFEFKDYKYKEKIVSFFNEKINKKYGYTVHKKINSLICPSFIEANPYLFK